MESKPFDKAQGKKRILIFSLEYYPVIGGAEVAVKEITTRISTNEIEWDMITMQSSPDLARHEKIGNVDVYRIASSKLLFPFEASLFARRLHAKRAYDAIWSIMAARAGGAALFFKYGFPEVKFILTLQEGDPIWYMKMRSLYYVNPFFRKIFKNADKVQAISNYLADYAKTMGHAGKVEVIPNGVDVAKFEIRNPKSERERIRKELEFEERDTVLITTSRLVGKNGVRYLIEALSLLPDDVKLLVIGSGPLEEPLKRKVARYGLEDRVMFLGHVSNEGLPSYLAACDIFIRPSLSEGFGISFIEAFAAGLPVVATPVGGIVDFLYDPDLSPGHKPTGLFAEVADAESIARQITRLTENAELRSTLVANAKKLVKERFEWDLVAKEMKSRVFDPTIAGQV